MSEPQSSVPRSGDRSPPNESRKPVGRSPGGATPPLPPRRTWLTFLLILAANILLVRTLFPGAEDPVTVPYTLFKQEAAQGNDVFNTDS